MIIEFEKMQGIGNDYVYIDGIKNNIPADPNMIRFMSDRHFGIGSDGVIFIRKSNIADAKMDMYNLDGSEGMMCGNGIRCVGKFVYDHGYSDSDTITIETRSGIKTLKMQVEHGKATGATVDMGVPIFTPSEIPANIDATNNEAVLNVLGKCYHATVLSMGNPHAVIFMKDIDSLDLERIGPHFENHQLFPQRVNTEFVEIIDENSVKMRVWERGSGETLACGTGACAVAVATVLNGLAKRNSEINVFLRGGMLSINWTNSGAVLMRGTATTVFTGKIDYTE